MPADVLPDAGLRARLVAAGAQLVTSQDASALSLREIARQAGVSHGAPRRYFPTHQSLLAAIAAEGYRELGLMVTTIAADETRPPRERILALAEAFLGFARARRGMFELMFRHDLLRGSASSDLLSGSTSGDRWRGSASGELRPGESRGDLRPGESRGDLLDSESRGDLLGGEPSGLREASLPMFRTLVDLVAACRPDSDAVVVAGALWANVVGIAQQWQWGSLQLATGGDDVMPLLRAAVGAHMDAHLDAAARPAGRRR